MGADQDAVEVGASLGIAAGTRSPLGRGKSREAMAAPGQDQRQLRAARISAPAAPMPAFTDAERRSLAGWPNVSVYLGGIRMPPSTRTTSAFM